MAIYCRFYEKDKNGKDTKDKKCYANPDNPKDVDNSTLRWYCSNRVSAWSNCKCYNRNVERDEDGFNVTTATCMKLGQKNGPVYNSLINLKHEEFLSNEKYDHFMRIYLGNKGEKAIGSKLSGLIIPDSDKEKIEKIYAKLAELAELANSGETDKERSAARELAAQRYIMLVLKLVAVYGLQEEYRKYRNNNTGYNQKKFAKTYTKNVEKHKKDAKTID